ncbi:alpha/beta fold hydrolase [Flavobacteriaceae bacterium Ap0902]|nr:alpha/beta fold hydrolase [Flavobacteriaceae bacterium Ap0902]
MDNLYYEKDILGDRFKALTLEFPDDYEGKVIATLIKRESEIQTTKAILYIHGFNDYYFQKELALWFNANHFDFYAIDLRKYGRSWLPHQKLNNVRNLKEYDAEIRKSIQIMLQEDHDEIIMMGHSTGGLILTNFVSRYNNPAIKGIILNSPFYDFNLNGWVKHIAIPLGDKLGTLFPNIKTGGGFNELYGKGLHKDYEGEWKYNLIWKPNVPPKVNLGFIHAIKSAQDEVRKGIESPYPFLIMHADKSTYPKEMNQDVFTSDIILNVAHIKEGGENIQGSLKDVPIKDGIHDLILSRKKVREKVYETMGDFLKTQGLI